ncbi:MAG: hypothetical protein HKN04_06815 [Rhodothermaceae bacterium]|nr:hypothetical protein [Rhodothermaceae bacterium]
MAPVDAVWGGLLRGHTYLIVGHAAAGRLRLATEIVRATAEDEGLCVFVSPRAPEALVREAQAIGFDLTTAYQAGHVHLLRTPPASDLAALGDDRLAHALLDLADQARAQQARRLVVEDFAAFVQFHTFDAFASAFKRFVNTMSALQITLVLGFGEPATINSEQLLTYLQGRVAATVRIRQHAEGATHLELIPGTAHAGAAEEMRWTTPAPMEDHASPEPLAAPALTETATHSADLTEPTGSDGFSAPHDMDMHPPDLMVPSPDLSADAVPSEPAEEDSLADVELTPITPIDPAEAPFPVEPDHDRFASTIDLDLFALGHFVDSRAHGGDSAPPYVEADPVLSTSTPPSSLEGTALAIHEAAYPELFRGAAVAAPPDEPAQAFQQALTEAFARREPQSFLVLALRMDPAGRHGDLFPAVAQSLNRAIGADGTLYGHTTTGRLLTLMPGTNTDTAQTLFAALKTDLQRIAPARADDALLSISAMVIPDGKPFASAEELMAYVA